MAHLDFKVTTWKRLHIPNDKIEEVIEKLKKSGCEEVYDLQDIEEIYFEDLDEFEETMTPFENEGCATQELYDSDGDIIYHNGDSYDH